MPESYAEQLAACRTVNEINRLNIGLEATLAPAEFERMVAGLDPAATPPAAVDWIARIRTFLGHSGQPIQEFATRSVAGRFPFYHHPLHGPDGRCLMIAFTGDTHRLMVPMPAFLQHCPAERFDILVLHDPTLSYYLRGVPGLADDFTGLLAAVDGAIDRRPYARVCTFGTSGGGLSAVWAALALDLDRGIAVCPTSPTVEDPRLAAKQLSYAPFLEVLRQPSPERTRILIAFGANCEKDRAKATALAGLLPAELRPVPGVAIHNVMYDLLRKGALRPFLEEMLSDAGPPA